MHSANEEENAGQVSDTPTKPKSEFYCEHVIGNLSKASLATPHPWLRQAGVIAELLQSGDEPDLLLSKPWSPFMHKHVNLLDTGNREGFFMKPIRLFI